ncbi:MAG: ester cyclase [Neisseria sp.]|uniref:nuclear transport factor 2 family protein n=1 Tax=Neisseria sp. TaxID=192066 RepID=UPI0026DB619C|nr:ester cyclase [Neisseria sp.]MDO4249497.1 ester cyclase [Neisseria sp.]
MNLKNTKTILTAAATAVLLAACTTAHNTPSAPVPSSAGTASSAEEARNKARVLDFYELAFNQHKLQEAVDKHIAEPYIQHNPSVGNGGKAFIDAFSPFLKANPQSRAEVKRAVAEGDLVVLHVFSQTSPQDKGEAVVDIFRLNGEGKIVEHWDVIQAMPDKPVHNNGMF